MVAISCAWKAIKHSLFYKYNKEVLMVILISYLYSAAFTNAEKELWTLLMLFMHLLEGTTSGFNKDTAHTQIKKTYLSSYS